MTEYGTLMIVTNIFLTMANVQFEEEDFAPRTTEPRDKTSKMALFLMRTGIVKNRTQARALMVGTIVFCMSLTFILLYNALGGGSGSASIDIEPLP